MSGLPYRTKMDMQKARENYLSYLKLMIDINDKNHQANKVYIKTGQLPSVISDTRTLTEKLADVQRLKVDMRSKLLEITDGIEASRIVNLLDEGQLVFLAQNFQNIKSEMKKMYALGVEGTIFINYLDKYIQKFNETKGVETGLQDTNKLLASNNVIMQQLPNKNELENIKKIIDDLGYNSNDLGRSIIDRLSYLENMNDQILEIINKTNNVNNEIAKNEIIELLSSVVNELPTKSDINKLLSDINLTIQKQDQGATINQMEKINEVLALPVDIGEEVVAIGQVIDQNEEPIKSDTFDAGPVVVPNSTQTEIIKLMEIKPQTKGEKTNYINDLYKLVGPLGVDRNKWIDRNVKTSENVYEKGFTKLIDGDLNLIINELNKLARSKLSSSKEGKGFRRNKMRGRGIASYKILDDDVDYNQGIKESVKFIPIGRYLINKRQLDRDIIAIKRTGGSIIKDLPSTRVSKNLSSIVKKILGGGMPSYEDVNNLDDREKEFLYNVAKHTRIEDKLSIPVPKKDQDEKDINEFEIMRGQILAGNDSPEVVKRFKSVLLKLSNKNMIPKAQIREILLDLSTLGH